MSLSRNSKLLTKKLYQYLIPSILMVFAMQFGSLLDGILIGNMISNEALTASSLVTPILFIIQVPGFALGVGGSIVAGIYLGKRDIENAKKTFSICIIAGVLISSIIAVLSPLIAQPVSSIYLPNELLNDGTSYIFGYMVTTPVLSLALIITSFMATDNNPNLSSIFFIVANVVKVASEILFISVFNWGMFGAAISTSFGYFIGFAVVIFYIKSKKRILTFSFNIKGGYKKLLESIKASLSTLLNFVLTAVQMSVANIIIANIITNPEHQLLFGIIANFVFGFELFVGGVIQLIPNLCTVCYGEQDFFALKSITKRLYFITIAITFALTVLFMIFPQVYCKIFGFDYNVSEGLNIMRVYLLSFIPMEINKFSQAYYPTIEKNTPAIVTVLCREIILAIPLLFIFLYSYGLMGYALSCVLTETLTVIITYIFIVVYNKKKKFTGFGLFMIPPYENIDTYDVTIDNDLTNVSILSNELAAYSKKHGIPEYESQIIALAGEEITNNIITYGVKNNARNMIDINLKIVNDNLILRIRDDGVIFDPTKYKVEEDENITSGIYLVQKLVNKLSYMRVMSTNYTVMEINTKIGKEE